MKIKLLPLVLLSLFFLTNCERNVITTISFEVDGVHYERSFGGMAVTKTYDRQGNIRFHDYFTMHGGEPRDFSITIGFQDFSLGSETVFNFYNSLPYPEPPFEQFPEPRIHAWINDRSYSAVSGTIVLNRKGELTFRGRNPDVELSGTFEFVMVHSSRDASDTIFVKNGRFFTNNIEYGIAR